MTTTRKCPECGTDLPVNVPNGQCPKCLLQVAIGSQPEEAGGTRIIPQPSPPPSPADLAKHFPQLEILELLGQGGMGVVYKARQTRLDRLVALKILPADTARDPAFAERFTREARALASLSHPNLVAVYDFGETDGIYYFVMEYVDGLNLRQLERAGKLSPRDALRVVPAICDALQFAHDQGIVHRDIKPENILVDKLGRVKIADFGLVKLLNRPAKEGTLTQTQQVMGTFNYMAPEQIETPQQVDHRADIYSLGVVFYEMLTGELPIGRFAPPSQKVLVDVRVDEVVLRTLEKERDRRYQHASDIKTDMEGIASTPGSAPVAAPHGSGYEYRSKATLFGLPLVHIAFGQDAATGKKRVAKGIVAIGDVAKGVVAIGGLAFGVVSIGGLSFGVFALGGLAFGGVALGGVGVALLLACAGLAVAPIAQGGLAVGYLAKGGLAYGIHAVSATGTDRVAADFFKALGSLKALSVVFKGLPAFVISLTFAFVLVFMWLQRRVTPTASSKGARPAASPGFVPPSQRAATLQRTGEVKPPPPPAQWSAIQVAAQQVKAPATGLLITGILNWLLVPVFVMVLMYVVSQEGGHSSKGASLTAALLGVIVASTFMMVAALKMKALEAYRLALAGSILAIAISPMNLVGLPLGIWALVTLTRPQVRDAFRIKASLPMNAVPPTATAPSPPPGDRARRWFFTTATVALIGLGVVALIALTGLVLSLGLPALLRAKQLMTQSPGTVFRAFSPSEATLATNLTTTADNAWFLNCTNAQVVRLFEVTNPDLEQCILTYRAILKTDGFQGRAYLEMWCRFPGQGESFSRGLDNVVTGSKDWTTCRTPFLLKQGEKPDLIRLNLAVEGVGKVWVRGVELLRRPSR